MATQTKAQIESELRAARKELTDFKKKVQARVIDAIDNEEVCAEGGYEALNDWGLEVPKKRLGGNLNLLIDFDNYECGQEVTRYGGAEPDDGDVQVLYDAVETAIEKALADIKVGDVHFSSNTIDDAYLEFE